MDERRERLVRRGNYVYGSFIKPESVDGYINCVNPGDRSDMLGRFPFSQASVDDAVEHARLAAASWRRVGLNDRAAALRRFRTCLDEVRGPAAALVARETGKPLWEARLELGATLRAVELLLDDGLELLAPRVLDEGAARSDRHPRGVVGILCPYAPALQTLAVQSAAAILAGNTVVAKPSKVTPAVGQLLAETWDRCRLPRGVFNLVQGSGSVVGKRLATHAGLDGLVCVGSFKTAMAVRSLVFDRPELVVHFASGGKGIAIVLDDADLDQAVYEVMIGAFLTAGQRHNTTARVIVQSQVRDRFVEALVRRSERLKVGYAFQPDVFMGPVISEKFRGRFRKYCKALATRGHEPLLAGQVRSRIERRGFYVTPAIHAVDWSNGQPFLNEEPPGPILLVYQVDSAEEAVALHNQAMYRLVCSVFTTRQGSDLHELADGLRSGAINVNRSTVGGSLRLPSVGLGRSSGGLPGGIELVRSLSAPRSQLVEDRPFDPRAVLPGVRWEEEVDDPPTATGTRPRAVVEHR